MAQSPCWSSSCECVPDCLLVVVFWDGTTTPSVLLSLLERLRLSSPCCVSPVVADSRQQSADMSAPVSKNGLGKDMWTLPLRNIENVLFVCIGSPIENRTSTDLLQYYYLGEIFYFASLTTTKISILVFLLRVFPQQQFRKIIYGVIGLCVAYGLSFVFATTFQCNPVPYSWMQLDSTYQGSCNNIHLQGWMSAIFNIILDLIILILPLKQLYALQTSLKKKLMVMVMFSLGIL